MKTYKGQSISAERGVLIPPKPLLKSMAAALRPEDASEMAIPTYLHWNPLIRWIARRRLNTLSSWANDYAGKQASALDFGCGCGILLPGLSRIFRTVYGVDLILTAAEIMVESYRLENIRLLTPLELESGVPQNGLDVIVASEVLEHVEDPHSLLQTLREKLKPKGHLLVSLPTENFAYRLGRFIAGFRGDYHLRSARDIDAAITATGYLELRRCYLPLPTPLDFYWVIDYALQD